jgi:hypothetical protein
MDRPVMETPFDGAHRIGIGYLHNDAVDSLLDTLQEI